MRITVDDQLCVGAGHCALADPEVFRQRDEDGVSEVLDPAPDAGHHPAVREAAGMCPVRAIRLTE